jgi:hypothetical protein
MFWHAQATAAMMSRMRTRARWTLLAISWVLLSNCTRFQQAPVDLDHVPPTPGFFMSDNLMGTVSASSDPKEVGKKITFVGLESSSPKVVFESGITSPLVIVHNDVQVMTLMLIASTGSVDTFAIDKMDGRFARASAGAFTGVNALASVGTMGRMQ